MTVRTRFAPSPTGYLHVGNARAALFCWLYARRHQGEFMLRLDDTDAERSTDAYADAIEEDLAWLGLDVDVRARQSERFARYDAVFAELQQAGRIYPCYETPDELELKRKRQLARGKPPVYDRAALALTAEECAALEAEGRQPHWRLKLSSRTVQWLDLVRGEQSIDCNSISDPVLRRADGSYLYTLPSVIDDIDFAVTHIVRGEDHVTNTATQIEIFEAMGAPLPHFAHFSLLQSVDGTGLSKRDGVLSLRDLRAMGLEAMSIISLIGRLGSADPVEAFDTPSPLIQSFDFNRLGRAPARFDVEELKRLNKKIIQEMPYAIASERLSQINMTVAENAWLAIRENLETLNDVAGLLAIIEGKVTPVIRAEDQEVISAAISALPQAPWDLDTWTVWTQAIKDETGRKGKALFMPLRLALTGLEHGPELRALLPLIGRERVHRRLAGEVG